MFDYTPFFAEKCGSFIELNYGKLFELNYR